MYALNTLAAVTGSLLTGFVLIPALGLERTLTVVAGLLAIGAVLAAWLGGQKLTLRAAGLVPVALGLILILTASPWDRELLASGSYRYASAIAPGLTSKPH